MTTKNNKQMGSIKRFDVGEKYQPSLFEMPEANAPSVQASAKSYSVGRVYQLPVADLNPDPAQPRKHFDQKELESLAQSLRELGVISPIIFRVDENEKLAIVAGERRWRAAKLAGIQKLPAILNSEDSPELVSLIENVIRCNLNPVELSEALEHVKNDKKLLDADLTNIFGWAASTLSEYRSLRKLPGCVRDDCLMRSDVPMDVLVLIARKEDESEMIKAYQDYLAGNASRNSLKHGNGGKSFVVSRYITSVEKRFSSIDVDSLLTKDRTKLGQSLDRLIKSLNALRLKVGDIVEG